MRRITALGAGVGLAVASVGALLLIGSGEQPAASPRPTASPTASNGGEARPATVSVGPTYDPAAVRQPTEHGSRRVWSARGAWWAVLLIDDASGQRIFRRDPASGTWQDTGTLVDARPTPFVDVVAEGDRVFVLSGGPRDQPSHAVRFTALTFDPAIERYRIDSNMPVQLTSAGVRSLSLARGGDGRTWAAFASGSRLEVLRGAPDDLHWTDWSPPAPVDLLGGTDIARIVGTASSVGVAWTDVRAEAIRFVEPADVAGDQPRWDPARLVAEVALQPEPDLAAIATGVGGVVLATRTTGEAADPGVMILGSAPGGSWRQAVFALDGDGHGPPALAYDADADRVIVAAASPSRGGTVFYKSSPAADLRFPAGLGTPLIDDPAVPSAASPVFPAGGVTAGTGLLGLASDRAVGSYATGWLEVGPGPGPGTAGPSPLAPPARVAQVLVDDRFAAWTPPGDPFPVTWQSVGAPGPLAVRLVTSPDGTVGRVETTAQGPGRACRPFDHLVPGDLRVRLTARAVHRTTEDAVVLSLRAPGATALEVRFGSDGAFAYSDGPAKVRSGVRYATGTWYVIEVVVTPAGVTDLTIRAGAQDGKIVLRAQDLAPPQTPAGPLERSCSASAAGQAGKAIEIRSLEVGGDAP